VADLFQWQESHGDEPKLCVLGHRREKPTPFDLPVDGYLDFSGSFRDLSGIIRCRRNLRRLVDEMQPDVIHSHLWPAVPFAAKVAGDCGVGCVVHVHDARPWLASGRLRYRAQRLAYRRVLHRARARIVAVAESVRQYTAKNLPWDAQAIEVIHNGIDIAKFQRTRRSEASAVTVGSVGRLEIEKGFDQLILAAAELKRAGLEFRVLIAGEGPQRDALLQLIQQLDLGGFVELPGVVTDMLGFYDQLDLFVLPSLTEGMPISILEAMAMGLPIVATTVGGIPELVRDGVEGLLVPAGEPGALAKALRELITSAARRTQIADNARRRVERDGFNHESMGGQFQRLYAAVVGSRQAAGAKDSVSVP
jgi:glycosyltransferase involved in cell wall biosynthesis